MQRYLFILSLFVLLMSHSFVWADPQITTDPDPIQMDRKQNSLSKFFFSGSGDIHYNNVKNANDTLEIHRLVIGFNYDFSDKIHFRSEVEFEHGFTEQYIEMAYLDFEFNQWINLRLGSIVLPVGIINTIHEPTTYYSVEKPDVYSRIIPSTWMEGGLGFWGSLADGLTYEIYGHTSLNFNDGFATDSGFSGSSGLRGGRGKVSNVSANDFAGTARLQYTGLKHFRFGTSGHIGFTDQGDPRVSGGLLGLIEADAKLFIEGFELEGLFAVIFNPDAGEMTTAQRTDGNISATDVIGQRMLGYMFEGAYHVFHHAWKEAPVDLVVFLRYEKFDTHNKVPTGFTKNQAFDRQNVTSGIAFYPVDQVVLKADYSWKDNGTNSANSQFNFGAGFYF